MYLDKIVIVVITNSLEINCKTLILKTKYKGFFMFRSKGVVNVPEPWTYFFRVSSLAYPNLLGKKGYVVVVVVVGVKE